MEDEGLTEWLLDHGSDPNAPCGLDKTPLSAAVQYASFHVIEMLFARGGTVEHGQLLHYAIWRKAEDRSPVVQYLLQMGAPVYLFEVEFIDLPCEKNLESIKQQISSIKTEVSCFIFEPLVQGSAGMLMYEAKFLDELMAHCKREGILTIADEVMTGFGRTGKRFACDHLTQKPDLMCFSKGLTGGTMPLGITTCTNQIFNAFLSEDKHKTLFHGHSFTANPVACAAALASLELFLKPETMENIERICHRHQIFADKNSIHPKLKSIRQTGTILAMEWNADSGTSYFSNLRDQLYQFFLGKNIILRPLGNIIYFLTPYCITDAQLNELYAAVEDALKNF